MADPLPSLESRRAELLRALANLKDMRPGSVVGAVFRCGKPTCHCAKPEDPGHGPNLRLTYKWHRKTVTEALPTPAAVRKAEREIAEFRDYQRLGRELGKAGGRPDLHSYVAHSEDNRQAPASPGVRVRRQPVPDGRRGNGKFAFNGDTGSRHRCPAAGGHWASPWTPVLLGDQRNGKPG